MASTELARIRRTVVSRMSELEVAHASKATGSDDFLQNLQCGNHGCTSSVAGSLIAFFSFLRSLFFAVGVFSRFFPTLLRRFVKR